MSRDESAVFCEGMSAGFCEGMRMQFLRLLEKNTTSLIKSVLHSCYYNVLSYNNIITSTVL